MSNELLKATQEKKEMKTDILDDLQITIRKAKAVSEAFSILYVDPARQEDRALEIASDPDRHCYLYAVLEDLIADSVRLADSIED